MHNPSTSPYDPFDPPALALPFNIKGRDWRRDGPVVDGETGEVVGFVLTDIPEDAPHDVREGFARRKLAALEGACPCGARLLLGNRAQRREAARTGRCPAGVARIEHAAPCPASELVLAEAIAAWERDENLRRSGGGR
jgi:hypothetical protein